MLMSNRVQKTTVEDLSNGFAVKIEDFSRGKKSISTGATEQSQEDGFLCGFVCSDVGGR